MFQFLEEAVDVDIVLEDMEEAEQVGSQGSLHSSCIKVVFQTSIHVLHTHHTQSVVTTLQ